MTGSIGGAMDIAVDSARAGHHEPPDPRGESKLLDRLTYPPTALGVVTKVFTNLGVFGTRRRLRAEEVAPDVGVDEVAERDKCRLNVDGAVRCRAGTCIASCGRCLHVGQRTC